MDIERMRGELGQIAKKSSEPNVLKRCATLLDLPPVQAVAGGQDEAIRCLALKKLLQAVDNASSSVHVKMAATLMLTHPGPGTKKLRQEAAARDSGDMWLARSIRRYEVRLLEEYLDSLIEFLGNRRAVDAFVQEARRSLGLASGTTQRSALRVNYEHRDEYERHFKQLVNDGAKLIALVGQPGMGKTWLADSLMRQYQPTGSNVAWITMEPDGSPSLGDLYPALKACGLPISSLTRGDPLFHLHRLMRDEEHAPRFVVLDNVEDTAVLNSLLPPETQSIVVVTTRLKTRPPDHCRILDIGPMIANEARALVRRLLPDLHSDEVDRLIRALHGFPLVIVFACRLIVRKRLSAQDFCDALAHNPPAVLSKVPVGSTENLVSVLADIVDLLEEEDEAAFDLLECAVLVGTLSKVPHCFLKRYLAGPDTSPTPGASATTYALAVESLLDFGLFEEADEDYLIMHPLTRDVLREMLSDGLSRVAAQVTMCVLASSPQRYKEEIGRLEFRDDGYYFEQPIFYEAIDVWRLLAVYKDILGIESVDTKTAKPDQSIPVPQALISLAETCISLAAAAAHEELADQAFARIAEPAQSISGQALLDEIRTTEVYQWFGDIIEATFGALDLSDPESIEMLKGIYRYTRVARSMRFAREGISYENPTLGTLMDMMRVGMDLLYKTSDGSTSDTLFLHRMAEVRHILAQRFQLMAQMRGSAPKQRDRRHCGYDPSSLWLLHAKLRPHDFAGPTWNVLPTPPLAQCLHEHEPAPVLCIRLRLPGLWRLRTQVPHFYHEPHVIT
jgi:hypothetical protein